MGVLAVTQRLAQCAGNGETPRKCLATTFGEPRSNRCVVGCRPRVRLTGQAAAQCQRGAAMLCDLVQHLAVLIRLRQHGDKIVVLRGGADQCRATDVDVLDAVIVRGTSSHRRLERIQIDRDQIDRRDTMLRHLRDVFRQIATPENAAVNLRHQRLHSPIEDLRKAAVFGYLGDRQCRHHAASARNRWSSRICTPCRGQRRRNGNPGRICRIPRSGRG